MQVAKVHEVWHFPVRTQYDPVTGEGGLFVEYVNMFLKMKTEASGWPANVQTAAEKEAFLREFEEREKIKLNPDNMIKNPGLRALAKLMLNSFWGKFGEKLNYSRTEYLDDPNA